MNEDIREEILEEIYTILILQTINNVLYYNSVL